MIVVERGTSLPGVSCDTMGSAWTSAGDGFVNIVTEGYVGRMVFGGMVAALLGATDRSHPWRRSIEPS